MKQTVLHDVHQQLNAKFGEFQGWRMPAQYAEPADEHRAVRSAAGLFDLCHLGRIEVSGAGAQALLQKTFTRSMERISPGAALYGLLCNEQGGILDDALLFCLAEQGGAGRYLLVTNARSTDKMLAWMTSQAAGSSVEVSNRTAALAQISLQGPRSEDILERIAGSPYKKIKPRHFRIFKLVDAEVMVSRTGYTGEPGYEFFVPSETAPALWNALMDAGKDDGLAPCGMLARDLLRIEMGYPLYGVDMDEARNPFEAGLGAFLDLGKEFIGRDALRAIKESGTEAMLAGFEMIDKSIPRAGGSIFSESREIGAVTSGALSPSVRKGIGLGYVVTRYAQPGQEIEIEVKDKEIVAKIVQLPFYRKK